MMEPVAIGNILLKAVLPKVAKVVVEKVNSKLNPTELEKALQAGITAAQEAEKSQPWDQWLFYRCDDKETNTFLARVFEHSAVQEELQKPLKNDGLPDIACLVKVFEQVAAELKIKLNQHSLDSWIREFVNTYFEKTNSYLKFQVAKEDYFEQLANWFDDVKFAGIPVAGQEVEKSEKLAYIFVMPDVLEEVQGRADNQFFQELAEETSNRQAVLIREQRQLAQLETRSGRKFLASQLLSQNQSRRCVLLGAPGSGKTTLMSYFAVMLAQKQPQKLGLDVDTDWLPILIRMRDLARQPEISILDYARQFAEKTMAVKSLPPGFFEYWLEDGRAVILLDGLDEVAEESKRYQVVSRIENFLGQFGHNRAIVTSRPAGYKRDFFRTEEFPHYQLQSFNNGKIEEFINHWYDSRIQDKAEAERRKDSLRKALGENERIKLLARNPLLLTIIALIHRYQARLPRQRYVLYDKAVETLLTAWDANKELSNHAVLKYIGLDDLRRVMERLAYWIHTQGSTGDKEGGTLIDRDELIEQLSREIRTLKGIKLHEAEAEAKRFVDFMRERTGLLNEQGQDCYAFVHKTFQEYLCAEEIDYQADNEGDFKIVLNHIAEHLHDPHWREVLLLLISQQKPKKAVRAIRKVVNHGSEYECWLHRDLLLAGSCLAEDIRNLNIEDCNLCQEILERLVELEVSDESRVGDKVREQVVQILCSLGETDFEAEVLQRLKDKAGSINERRLQRYQAALGEKEAVTQTLLARLQDEDSQVRSRAANALGDLGKGSEMVLQALLARLQDEDSQVRRAAAFVLGKLGNSSETVVEALLAHLQDEDSQVRFWAAFALSKLGNSSETVVQALLSCLQDEDSQVRSRAANALGRLGKGSETVVQALLPRLQDEDSQVRFSAADALGNLGNSSETVVQALLVRLQDDDSQVRFNAVDALGYLGNSSETVVQALLARLQDENFIVRFSAADALGNLGNSSETVVRALLPRLQDEDSQVRSSAADALGKLGNSSETVVQALLPCLQDNYSGVRSSAAGALGRLGKGSETVVQALLPRLQDEDSGVRSSAARALGKLGKKSKVVATAVTQWIEQHQDSEYVGNGIDVLWDLVTGE